MSAQLDLLPANDRAPRETTRSVVARTIEADQDFEFYPTTDEIIRALVRRLKLDSYGHNKRSVLDIGAGNGKVLKALRQDGDFSELYAIEKSTILCQQLDPDILIVGTEFAEQSLLSKSVDVIFCNPPYSQFVPWSEKIIRQGAAARIYLVIPERWTRSVEIADAIKFRDADVKTVGKFDFEDAEDRRARAVVNLVEIKLHADRHKDDGNDDAFERFFREEFADLINKFEEPGKTENADEEDRGVTKGGRKRPFSSLVVGPEYPEALVNIYNEEMAHIRQNYQLVSELDVDLLREFDISPPRIMACLKARLAGLRSDYWNELFSRLSAVTNRLASQSRKNLLETLQRHVHVDFTLSNIYAVVVWILKNANRYIDSQLIATFETMVDKCNVILYKSNRRTWRDEQWRYCRDDEDKPNRFKLDYRIVTHRIGGVNDSSYSWEKGLNERGAVFLGDLLTIARNLGFHCQTVDHRLDHNGRRDEWKQGVPETFQFVDKDGSVETLFEARGFKNGNMHIRMNQRFILALNVEHGRLKGWLRSPEEAVAELGEESASQFFRSNLQLARGDVLLLGN